MESLEDILDRHPFFAGFEAAHGRLVAGCARNVRFAAGQYLFREGDPADEFFLIRHGKVALELIEPGRPPVVFATLGEGEIVGASWLLPPYRWRLAARAVELTRAIGIDAACLRGKCEADHHLGYEMMKRFCRSWWSGCRPPACNCWTSMESAEMAAPDPFLPQPYRVERRRRELIGAVTLDLAPLAGERPDFLPGQFNMLYVFGVGEVAISLSGDAERGTAFVHTVRNVGAVSGALTRLEVGASVGVRGPFGSGWPLVEAEAEGADVLLVAGGLGLAPLRPALYALLARRERYGRVVIMVGSRSPEDILYRRELEHWRRRADLEVLLTVDHADADWRGHVGVVPALIPHAGLDPVETLALVCGPEVMMRFTANALLAAGVRPERIHLSMERNMKCAVAQCGHCQFGPFFVCREGPVLRYDRIAGILAVPEI
ncbi:cyclic nucleotide-binding domain-containing protein [Azotobacter sp. CWF10]